MYGSIYKITCIVNNKIYIGKTTKTIQQRFDSHCKASQKPRTFTSYLYNAMNKYGVNNFTITLIENCNDEKTLNEREKFWIRKLKSQDPNIGYNIQEGGEGGRVRSKEFKLSQNQLKSLEYGRHLPSSKKHKEQLSKRRKGIIVAKETREKLRIARLGKKASKETREKLSRSHKGLKMPERTLISREKYRKASSNRIHIHKGNINKNPKLEDLQKYLDEGYELGYCYNK